MITGPEPGLTRDAVASDLEWSGRKVRLFDTAGLRRKAQLTEAAEKLGAQRRHPRHPLCRGGRASSSMPSARSSTRISPSPISSTQEGRALVLAINKWDLVEDKQKTLKELREGLTDRLAQVPGVALVPISALGGRELDKLSSAILAAYDTWNRRVSTSALNRWLEEALSRHAPPGRAAGVASRSAS